MALVEPEPEPEPVEVLVEPEPEPMASVEPEPAPEPEPEVVEPVVDLVEPSAPETNGARRGFRMPWVGRRTPQPVVEPEPLVEPSAASRLPGRWSKICWSTTRRPAAPEDMVETSTAAAVEDLAEADADVAAESEERSDELADAHRHVGRCPVALIPEVVEEPDEPEIAEVPVDDVAPIDAPEISEEAPERVVEEPIAHVDAAVQALMALLPGSVEVPSDEVKPEEVAADIESSPAEAVADDAIGAPAARVDASVDELLALLTPPEVPAEESEGIEVAPAPAARADAEPDDVDATPEPPVTRRRRRSARRRAELAAAIEAAARALDESEPDAVVAEPEPEPEPSPSPSRGCGCRRARAGTRARTDCGCRGARAD